MNGLLDHNDADQASITSLAGIAYARRAFGSAG